MKITGTESNIYIMQELARRAKETRIDRQLTQKDLAQATNLSLRTISNFEIDGNISFANLLSILRVLGLLQNIDLLVPDAIIKPFDYLKKTKKKLRVRRKIDPPGFVWEEDK